MTKIKTTIASLVDSYNTEDINTEIKVGDGRVVAEINTVGGESELVLTIPEVEKLLKHMQYLYEIEDE